jgi:ribosome biogenesis GTPase A
VGTALSTGLFAFLEELSQSSGTKTDAIIALAGNPNTGKSTVFNGLTGLKQHTGNWPGKTVVLTR